MAKRFFLLIVPVLLVLPQIGQSQSTSDEEAIMETIATFFKGFAAKDEQVMRSVTDPGARLVITAADSAGVPVMRPVTMDEFFGFITNSQREIVETYWDPEIYVHDNLATVWMDYNLWVGDVIDHCGKDNFQLFRSPDGWRIIAIADTQRKEGCKPKPERPSQSFLYLKGTPYQRFLQGVNARKEMWYTNNERKKLSDHQRKRVEQISKKWYLLAVAEDRCSDSANTIPYLSVLLDESDNIDLRIVDARAGSELLEKYRTPDGRSATPTVVLLDSDLRERGAWVERPAGLQEWAMANRDSVTQDEFMTAKFAWYDADGGTGTINEVLDLIEQAEQEDDR